MPSAKMTWEYRCRRASSCSAGHFLVLRTIFQRSNTRVVICKSRQSSNHRSHGSKPRISLGGSRLSFDLCDERCDFGLLVRRGRARRWQYRGPTLTVFCEARKFFANAGKYLTEAKKFSAKSDVFRSKHFMVEPLRDV